MKKRNIEIKRIKTTSCRSIHSLNTICLRYIQHNEVFRPRFVLWYNQEAWPGSAHQHRTNKENVKTAHLMVFHEYLMNGINSDLRKSRAVGGAFPRVQSRFLSRTTFNILLVIYGIPRTSFTCVSDAKRGEHLPLISRDNSYLLAY